MVAATRPWAAARRRRVSPFEDDPNAACRSATGGADGRQPPLSAVYGHDGTGPAAPPAVAATAAAVRMAEVQAAEEGVTGVAVVAVAPPPAWAAHAHDAARLHAVATAPGNLQHMSAAAAARALPDASARGRGGAVAGAAAESSESQLAGRWPASSSASSLSSGASVAGGRSGLANWMGWLPRGRHAPVGPAAAPSKSPAQPAPTPAPPAPPTPEPLDVAAPSTQQPQPRRALPPSEALACLPGAPAAATAAPLHVVPSDPGLYRPGKTCDEGTQTWLPAGPGVWRLSRREPEKGVRHGILPGLARSVAAGAAAGVAVLLLGRATDAPAAPAPRGVASAGAARGRPEMSGWLEEGNGQVEEQRVGVWRDSGRDARRAAAAPRRIAGR
jgi:hypothetical protein